MRPNALFVAAWLTAALNLHSAALQKPTVDVAAIGPHIGQPVPDFTLPDQTGTPRSLKSIFGAQGAMLVFFRSADW